MSFFKKLFGYDDASKLERLTDLRDRCAEHISSIKKDIAEVEAKMRIYEYFLKDHPEDQYVAEQIGYQEDFIDWRMGHLNDGEARLADYDARITELVAKGGAA